MIFLPTAVMRAALIVTAIVCANGLTSRSQTKPQAPIVTEYSFSRSQPKAAPWPPIVTKHSYSRSQPKSPSQPNLASRTPSPAPTTRAPAPFQCSDDDDTMIDPVTFCHCDETNMCIYREPISSRDSYVRVCVLPQLAQIVAVFIDDVSLQYDGEHKEILLIAGGKSNTVNVSCEDDPLFGLVCAALLPIPTEKSKRSSIVTVLANATVLADNRCMYDASELILTIDIEPAPLSMASSTPPTVAPTDAPLSLAPSNAPSSMIDSDDEGDESGRSDEGDGRDYVTVQQLTAAGALIGLLLLTGTGIAFHIRQQRAATAALNLGQGATTGPNNV